MVSLDYNVIRPHDKVDYEFNGMLNYDRAVTILNEIGYAVDIPSPYKLYNLIRSDPAVKTISAKWMGSDAKFKNRDPDMKNDNTYEECVVIKLFSYEGTQIGIRIDVWDGDSYHGYPTTRRSSYECVITEYRAWIDHIMLQLLNLKALAAVIAEEEIERLAKIALARDKILRNL